MNLLKFVDFWRQIQTNFQKMTHEMRKVTAVPLENRVSVQYHSKSDRGAITTGIDHAELQKSGVTC